MVQLYSYHGEGPIELTIDTSVVMAVVLNEAAKPALVRASAGMELMAAPTVPWEVGNALSALLRRGRIDIVQSRAALESFGRIPIRLADVDVGAGVETAHRFGIYAYDAYVLECALRYRTPFLSLDRRQVAVARELGIDVLEIDE